MTSIYTKACLLRYDGVDMSLNLLGFDHTADSAWSTPPKVAHVYAPSTTSSLWIKTGTKEIIDFGLMGKRLETVPGKDPNHGLEGDEETARARSIPACHEETAMTRIGICCEMSIGCNVSETKG